MGQRTLRQLKVVVVGCQWTSHVQSEAYQSIPVHVFPLPVRIPLRGRHKTSGDVGRNEKGSYCVWGLSLELDESVTAAAQVSPRQKPHVLQASDVVALPDL